MSAFTMRLKKVCNILDAHGAYDDQYPANETVYYDGFSSPLNLWMTDDSIIDNASGRMVVSATDNSLATFDLTNLIPGRTYHLSIQAMTDLDGFTPETIFNEIRWQGAAGGGGSPLTWQMTEFTTDFVAAHETETVQLISSGTGAYNVYYDNFRVTGGSYTVAHAADYSKLGFGTYPIFNSTYRDSLNQKIVDHYWNREIGFETIELFTFKVKTLMNEIMPYYNQLYTSTLVEIDPLSTIDLTTESTGHGESTEAVSGDSTALNTTDGQSRSVSSSTPQTMLSGDEDYATGAADGRSLTNADSTASQSSESSSESDTLGETRVSGYQGAAATLIMNYRDSLINIDLMVIRDLEQLFMQVFDNSSSYTQRGLFW